MKNFKSVYHLWQKAGFTVALFYIFYRLKLKLYNSKACLKCRIAATILMENITDHLFVYDHKQVKIKEKVFLEINENGKKIYLRPFSSDKRVFYQIFKTEEYKEVVGIYKQLFCESPEIIVDMGANIGLTSVYFSNLFPLAKIIAVEPFSSNCEVAEINMSENIAKFNLIKGGIWNKNTSLSMNRSFRDGKEWSINLQEDKNGDIRGYCILEFVNQFDQNIDILKIDIEGSEKRIFENEDYVSKFLKKIKCLAIEIHDEFDCRATIYNLLNKNRFIYFNNGETTIAINKNYL